LRLDAEVFAGTDENFSRRPDVVDWARGSQLVGEVSTEIEMGLADEWPGP